MKKYLFLFVFSSLLLSCDNDEGPTSCGVENPVEDLAWIKASIEDVNNTGLSEYSYLSQAKYQGETLFFFGSCCPFCNWALIVTDCQGNALEGDIRLTDLSDVTVIWQPANSVCDFS